MHIKHYAWVFRHWLWLILVGTALCTVATFVVSKSTLPVYEASALIQVNTGGSDASSVFNDQALAVSYAIQVTSNDVLQDVAKNLPNTNVSQLGATVSASPLNNTQVIEVRADANRAQQAADIANTVVTVFIQHQVARETEKNNSIASKLIKQQAAAKSNVNNAEAQLTKLESTKAPQDLITHQREVLDGYQVNYNALLTSYNQLQLQESMASSKLSIAQSAIPPTSSKGPRTTLNTAVAAILGLLLMITLVLLLDWMDSTIKTPEDVARLALLEPLGSVPQSKGAAGTSLVNDRVEQAFVTISTNFSVLGKGKRSILVTSLHSGAGTSTTAIKLARSLAQSGMRVLLVDANLRQPSLHQAFNLPNTAGLTNSVNDIDVLQEQVGFTLPLSTDEPNLWLLPTGPQSSNSSTILHTSKLQMFAERLLQAQETPFGQTTPNPVDIIIFDTPSLEQGADTIALAPITDGTVLVIEAGKERAEVINKVQATLQRLGSPIIGVVVNRQKAKHRTYFYAKDNQQAMVSAESSHSSSASKYPVLQTRAFPSKALPETSLLGHIPQAVGTAFDDTAQQAVAPAPNTNTVKVQKMPSFTSNQVPTSLPQTNGSQPNDTQDGV